jgi:hypothetical protein
VASPPKPTPVGEVPKQAHDPAAAAAWFAERGVRVEVA